MKDKMIKIRSTQEEKEKCFEVVKKHGFTSLASFWWFCINQWDKRK